jgi:hypothetical protein
LTVSLISENIFYLNQFNIFGFYLKAFSPFGLAAGSKTGARGESSGCSGPFCTMSTGNSVGGASAVADMTSSAADESFNDGMTLCVESTKKLHVCKNIIKKI